MFLTETYIPISEYQVGRIWEYYKLHVPIYVNKMGTLYGAMRKCACLWSHPPGPNSPWSEAFLLHVKLCPALEWYVCQWAWDDMPRPRALTLMTWPEPEWKGWGWLGGAWEGLGGAPTSKFGPVRWESVSIFWNLELERHLWFLYN